MSINDFTILKSEGVKTNFNDFNTIQNRYNSKMYQPKRQAPRKLIAAAIREFKEFCETYHIEASKYKFIEPCEVEGIWRQFDFLDSVTDKYPARIMVSGIIYRKNTYTILQREISI